MSELKALSDAATQGVFHLNQPDGVSIYMRHDDGVRGRHIADTGRISSQAPKHIIDQDKANAKLVCAAVNGIRNGTLVDAKQARMDALQEAVDSLPEQYAIYGNDRTDGYARGFCGGVETYRDALTALMEADT